MRLTEFAAEFKTDWKVGDHIILLTPNDKKVTLIMKDAWQARELFLAARAALRAHRSRALRELNDHTTLLNEGV